jgi:hypothetical protein
MFPQDGQPRKNISSWKEIAAYFGVTVRTAQTWEEERGLPVHRMPGVKGRVYAYEDELAAWANQAPPVDPAPDAPQLPPAHTRRHSKRWVLLAAGLMLIAAAFGLLWLLRPAPVPSTASVAGRTLIVKDAEGRPIWQHEYPGQIDILWESGLQGFFPETRPWIGDLDGDGTREVLFTYQAVPRTSNNSELYCFEADGKLRWRYVPGHHVSTRSEQFPPPYLVRMVLVHDAGPGKPPVLLVVGIHSVYYPSQIAALSPKGKVLRQYWHSGHINLAAGADLDGDGRAELYLMANHNPSKSVSVIALDPMDFGGASLESNADYQIQGMGQPNEMGRIVFPTSELTRRLFDLAGPAGMRTQAGRLFLGVHLAASGADKPSRPQVFYQLGPRFDLLGIEYPWNFRSIYESLLRQGRIKPYDLDADLERMKQLHVVTPWRSTK